MVTNVQLHAKNETTAVATTTPTPTTPRWDMVPEWMQDVLDPQGEEERRRRRRRPFAQWMWHNPQFVGLTRWAFGMCDAAGDGRINRDELYAGILLVHLHLAKYVGVTACHPLNRTEVNELFDMAAAADPLGSLLDRQTIGPEAFADIVLLSCAKISSRMAVYYALLVVGVPFLTRHIIGLWQQGVRQLNDSVQYLLTRHMIRGRGSSTWCPPTSYLASWTHHVWALAEWTVQHLLTVMVVTVIMPWIFVKLNEMAPRWMRPKRNFWER